jgi:hypothetical protein
MIQVYPIDFDLSIGINPYLFNSQYMIVPMIRYKGAYTITANK